MKRMAVLVVMAALLAPSTPALASSIAGARCTKAGSTRTTAKVHYVCVRVGGHLLWHRTRTSTSPSTQVVTAPTPAPTTSPTPAPSDTPTQRTRQTTDQPDLLSGFQIKPFYVVPSDGTDRHLDTDGTLDHALTEGDAFLQQQIGYHLQVDQRTDGYDIEYLHSQYTTAQLSAPNADQMLMAEAHVMDDPGSNRKHFLFFIEVPSFSGGSTNACGYGDTPGLIAEVAVADGPTADGSTCTGSDLGFTTITSALWVHEVLHTLGVTHTFDDPCDLMYTQLGICPNAYVLDPKHVRYVGAAVQGVNLLTLRVWAGHAADPGLRADCDLPAATLPRSNGRNYAYCPTGTQTIGELAHCWSPAPTAQLQALVDGTWTAVGSVQASSQPWGPAVALSCADAGFLAASARVTRSSPGIVTYRWLISGTVDETFDVIWVA